MNAKKKKLQTYNLNAYPCWLLQNSSIIPDSRNRIEDMHSSIQGDGSCIRCNKNRIEVKKICLCAFMYSSCLQSRKEKIYAILEQAKIDLMCAENHVSSCNVLSRVLLCALCRLTFAEVLCCVPCVAVLLCVFPQPSRAGHPV